MKIVICKNRFEIILENEERPGWAALFVAVYRWRTLR